MQEREARILIEAGALRGCTSAPAPLEPGKWVLLLHLADGRTATLERQRGGDRVFAKLDSVAEAVKALGIRGLTVKLSF